MKKRANPKRVKHAGQLSARRLATMKDEQKRALLPPRAGCPNPGKIGYGGRKEAKAALKQIGKEGMRGRLHVYKCVCAHFHIGTAATKPQLSK